MIPYEAVFGQKPRIGLATKVPRQLVENIMTGTLEEDIILKMLLNEDKEDNEDVQVLNTETIDLERTQDTEEVLEATTACSQHNIIPENKIEQKLEKLIKTTQKISDIESDTDKVSLCIKCNLNY
ncbi:uncharacterized protein LOC132926030 [Rhopalosiphum padi]|uniref:uncharacterized protein LOC132926030 n=1 Tax=Rhopalosiphum padi TaxID=40932 RepID=UPI00298DD4FD|nr:uncharacterized protein LOC132926030 [Rhopalosiphum padi]